MDDYRQRQIARINELSALARNSWLVLLAYLAYIGITLLAFEDADFFVPTQKTELPLVGIAIPTTSFFALAPPLGAALYIYLHIHLLKLFDVLGTAPARIEGEPLGDLIHPWLANDLLLTMRGDNSVSERPLRMLSNVASLLLVWVAGPMVLVGFWWQSMPAHNEWLTLFLTSSLIVTCHAGVSSWVSARSASMRGFKRPLEKPWQSRVSRSLGCSVVLLLVSLSWLRTEGGFDHYYVTVINIIEETLGNENIFDEHIYPSKINLDSEDKFQPKNLYYQNLNDKTLIEGLLLYIFGLSRTELNGSQLVKLPDSWRSYEKAKPLYREEWCRIAGIGASLCSQIKGTDDYHQHTLSDELNKWCSGSVGVNEGNCLERFKSINSRFQEDWREERGSMVAALPQIDLSRRDLRNTSAFAVSLVGANLKYARLDSADLTFAQMESAKLSYSRMPKAELRLASLENAILLEADMRGTSLVEAKLNGALFALADLQEADFRRAKLAGASLVGADMRMARFDDTDLREAALSAGVLTEAIFKNSDLRGTNFERAKLDSADFSGSDLLGTNFTSADLRAANLSEAENLTQAQLEFAVGNARTILPSGVAPDTGEPFYVWNCFDRWLDFEPIMFRMSDARLKHFQDIIPCDKRRKIITGTVESLKLENP